MAFVLTKHLLVSACVLLLWQMRRHRLALVGLQTTGTVYSLLVMYHVGMNLNLVLS
jgi:hypothetical protein